MSISTNIFKKGGSSQQEYLNKKKNEIVFANAYKSAQTNTLNTKNEEIKTSNTTPAYYIFNNHEHQLQFTKGLFEFTDCCGNNCYKSEDKHLNGLGKSMYTVQDVSRVDMICDLSGETIYDLSDNTYPPLPGFSNSYYVGLNCKHEPFSRKFTDMSQNSIFIQDFKYPFKIPSNPF